MGYLDTIIDLWIRFFKFLFRRDVIGPIFLAIIAVFLVFGALKIHEFGHPEDQEYIIRDDDGRIIEIKDVERNPDMDDYIIGGTNETTGDPYGTQIETGANNAVTSVVFDYRGFDTLGEATVLFTAVAGVIMIFRRQKK